MAASCLCRKALWLCPTLEQVATSQELQRIGLRGHSYPVSSDQDREDQHVRDGHSDTYPTCYVNGPQRGDEPSGHGPSIGLESQNHRDGRRAARERPTPESPYVSPKTIVDILLEDQRELLVIPRLTNASAEPTSGAAPNPCPFKLISARADPLNEYDDANIQCVRERDLIRRWRAHCHGRLLPLQEGSMAVSDSRAGRN